jgi:hypothetical protein
VTSLRDKATVARKEGGSSGKEDLGTHTKSVRQAAKANTAIYEAEDDSSGLSSLRKKNRPSPPSPQRGLVSKGRSAKAGPTKANATVTIRKRQKADDDFEAENSDEDDELVDEDDVQEDAMEAPAAPIAKAIPAKTKTGPRNAPAKNVSAKAGPKKAPVKTVAGAVPAPAAAGRDDADDVFRLVVIERAANRCTCVLVVKLAVGKIKTICGKLDPPVNFRERVNNANRDMRKKMILIQLCRICNTEDDVTVAIAAAGYYQGVSPKFWHPRVRPAALSLLAAFHHAMQLAASDPANEEIREVLNEFRAHFAKMLSVNFRFYVVEGKINKADDVGQHFVLSRIDRFAHFVESVKSALNHYRGIHSDMTCGRLRKNLVCVPFRLFQNCDPRVQQILKAKVEIFLLLVMEDELLLDIDVLYADQAKLNVRFGFYFHSLRNSSVTRFCQFGKLLNDRKANETTIFQCVVDMASPFKQKNRKCA